MLQEATLQLPTGSLAIKAWGEIEASPVLALHGWMDNAATFDRLAPCLAGVRVVAPDLAGHGHSSHRAEQAEYYIWSYVEEVLALADSLKLRQFTLLGHSMGGAIACLIAALYPLRVKCLALLDSLGPLATDAHHAPQQMLKALQQKATLRARGGQVRHYPSELAAQQARAAKGLALESAKLLGARGIAEDEQGFYWNTDRRLARANLLSMTEPQIAAFMQRINCPSILLAAAAHEQPYRRALLQRRQGYVKDLELVQLDGHHHQHLEGRVEQVAQHLNRFFSPKTSRA